MILANMAGLARPARMAENSSRVVSTDLSILPSASLRMSLITAGSLPVSFGGRAVCRRSSGPEAVERPPVDGRPSAVERSRRYPRVRARDSVGRDERPNLLTLHDPQDVALLLHAEHDQRQLVLHAQRERRG